MRQFPRQIPFFTFRLGFSSALGYGFQDPFIRIKNNKSNSFFIPGQLALIRVRDKNVSGRKTLVLSVIRKGNAEKPLVLRNLKSPRLLSKLRKKTLYLINLKIENLNPRVACSSASFTHCIILYHTQNFSNWESWEFGYFLFLSVDSHHAHCRMFNHFFSFYIPLWFNDKTLSVNIVKQP